MSEEDEAWGEKGKEGRCAVKRRGGGEVLDGLFTLETLPGCTSPFHPCLMDQVVLPPAPLKSGQRTGVLWSLSEENGQSVRVLM